jgi:AraC family transcriptional regulator, arabinose operon regulatory protein
MGTMSTNAAIAALINQPPKSGRGGLRTIGGAQSGEILGGGASSHREPIHKRGTLSHYALIYVLEGSGDYRVDDGEAWPIRPGSIYHEFPHRRREVLVTGGYTECYLCLGPSLFNYLLELGIVDIQRPVRDIGLDLGLARELIRYIDAIPTLREAALAPHLARGLELVTRLIMRGAEHADPEATMIDEVCELLAQRLNERLSLEALTKHFPISYERLRKIFRQRMGLSPGEYRIRRRIDRARELLTRSTAPLTDIADALGYDTPFAFSRQFKQVVGVPPSEYRHQRL